MHSHLTILHFADYTGESIDRLLGEHMKKRDLLNYFDEELLEKLFGFCYARTGDSYEAEELCSDITYALIKAADTDGEIESLYPFIWKVARNVYADFSDRRAKRSGEMYAGDPKKALLTLAEEDIPDDRREQLAFIYRRIAFLTRAYREVMILFYIDGLPASEIAILQKTSETAVRQRLFSARQKIRNEVEKMTDTAKKPVTLNKIDYIIWGSGNPTWGDPRETLGRLLSDHIIWLCSKKAMSASEIAAELNVPTVYVEDELEILRNGTNGKYGVLRRLDNDRYAINFILFDKETAEKAHSIYTEQIPNICKTVESFIEAHREEYLAFPYLNRKTEMNLILWQQIRTLSDAFSDSVTRILKEKYFSGIPKPDRPFSIFGYVNTGKTYGGGCDGAETFNVCGLKKIRLTNIYVTRIKKHFHCGHNVANDGKLRLAIRAIDGLDISTLSEIEKEHAAKAIECGYLYRDGNMLYTKILVSNSADDERLFGISERLKNGYFDSEAAKTAEKLAELIKTSVPDYLLCDWRFANDIAGMPVLDALIEVLIERGILTQPENGIGAEGCWMQIKK